MRDFFVLYSIFGMTKKELPQKIIFEEFQNADLLFGALIF